jgi:hypothetical protein
MAQVIRTKTSSQIRNYFQNYKNRLGEACLFVNILLVLLLLAAAIACVVLVRRLLQRLFTAAAEHAYQTDKQSIVDCPTGTAHSR